MTPVNVATHLVRLAACEPYRPAVFCPAGRDAAGRTAYAHLTFRQLDAETDRLARGLRAVGVGRGMPHGRSWCRRRSSSSPSRSPSSKPGRCRADRPRHGRRRTSASASPRPSRRRSSASPKRTSPARLLGWGSEDDPGHCVTVGDALARRPAFARGLRPPAATAAGPFPVADGRRTRRPPSCSPAAAPASPRGSSTRTASSPPRWNTAADAVRHRAGRGRSADVPAVRPVRPGAGHDGRRPGDGPDPARPRRSRQDRRGRSRRSASRTCSARRPCCAASAARGPSAASACRRSGA